MPAWMDEDLERKRQQGLYRRRRTLQSGQAAEVRLRNRDLVNFASNDYLCYAGDPRLARSACRATRRYGTGAGASPLVSGRLPPLRALERDLAAWQNRESALVFSSGFVANLAILSSLVGPEDAIFSDAQNHASLIDGCRLSRARIHVYEHKDLAQLDQHLHHFGRSARRRLIVSDSVFSMEGDLADLTQLHELACKHDALLILDEAHALGVLGEHGRGCTDSLADPIASSERLIKLGTLSKALGSQGGFVCGSQTLIRWLVNQARPYIFSTALAPAAAAAARRAIFLIGQEPERRQRVLGLAQMLRTRLQDLGWNTGNAQAHLVPVIVGCPREAVALSRRLETKGLLVPAIRPPAVSPGSSRLRVSLSAGHQEEDVERLVDALRSA